MNGDWVLRLLINTRGEHWVDLAKLWRLRLKASLVNFGIHIILPVTLEMIPEGGHSSEVVVSRT